MEDHPFQEATTLSPKQTLNFLRLLERNGVPYSVNDDGSVDICGEPGLLPVEDSEESDPFWEEVGEEVERKLGEDY